GTRIPIAEVIRLAAHAHHSLAVFDKATGSALDLFRARRVASPAQRIMLIARDGGCTKPGCTVGAYGSQAHHVVADWNDGGNTNVDELGLACGPDNRAVSPDGWTTRMNERGEVEWIPPPALDTGQTRINTYHRPERLLRPPDEEPMSSPDIGPQSDGGAVESTPSSHCDQPGETPCGDNHPINDEPIDYERVGDALMHDEPIDYERVGDALMHDEPIDYKPIDHEPMNDALTGDEPISYELIEDAPSDHEPSDHEPSDHEPSDQEPIDDGPIDDEPIDYELTEPAPSDHPGETEKPEERDEPSSPREPGDPDKPDESSNPGQPGGPAPPDGQAA
ncbi:HNH endonuclease signature motif containing protein, partial [Mycolicibacterium sp. OfavD-34-C]|uniref:HNH endonuclease signature motif containing protein n=1 Tax=Mycolicibacterium sp. OfavD-34-C TaxID=2917746 RepID=UPI001EF5AEB6|nr:HNH endonuclease [Mycolicibacterium sp. OfavD-34-C]